MSDYTQTTDFSVKDGLASGNPSKLILGTEFDVEFAAISAAIATKYDSTDLASQAQAEAEASSSVLMTPLRVANWADYNAGIVGDLQALVDPNADGILFWDDSAGAAAFLSTPVDGGLLINGTDLEINVQGLAQVTPTTSDEFLIADASDAGAPKAVVWATLITALQTGMNHDSLTGFVADEHVAHSGVTITAGTGLSGGGTIAASRTINLDISGLTAIDIASIAASDGILIDDGGTMKRASIQSLGTRIQASATQTLALDDGNSLFVNTGASDHTITIPANATVAFPIGTEIGAICQSTGNIIFAPAGGVTLTSLSSNRTVKASGGGAYLVKTATNTWSLVGDLEA